jgi:hypothetical protein
MIKDLPCCGNVKARPVDYDLPNLSSFAFSLFKCVGCDRFWVVLPWTYSLGEGYRRRCTPNARSNWRRVTRGDESVGDAI